MPIEAGQLIYANVETEHSYRQREGFQTVFVTPNWLTPQEQQLVESRLIYDSQLCAQKPKYLYFPIGTDRRVVVRLMPRHGQDKYGRELMLAHALIIREETWCEANFTPVQLFRQAPFIADLAAALRDGDLRRGTIPALQLPLPQPTKAAPLKRDAAIAAAQAWVIHDQERQSKRQVLARVAAPVDAESTLEFLDQLCRQLPQALQRLLAFNSCCKTSGANSEVRSDWFLLGLPHPDADYRVLTLNNDDPVALPTEPLHPYEHWLKTAKDASEADFATAWPVAGWLAKLQPAESWCHTPHAVWQAVCKANPKLLEARFSAIVQMIIPSPLDRRIIAALNPQDTSTIRMQQFLNGISQAELIDAWFQALLHPRNQSISIEEQRVLATLNLEPRWQLVLMLLKKQFKPAQQILRDLSEADYISLVTQLIAAGYDFADLFVTGRIDALLAACRNSKQTVPLVKIILVLAEYEPDLLTNFINELDRLTEQEVRRLQPLVSHREIPPQFIQRLQQRMDKLPTVWSSLFGNNKQYKD